eukprot:403372515
MAEEEFKNFPAQSLRIISQPALIVEEETKNEIVSNYQTATRGSQVQLSMNSKKTPQFKSEVDSKSFYTAHNGIEDFFGIDYKEMQKIVNDNKTEINNDKVISKRSSLVTPQAKDELKQNLQETFGQYVSQQELLNKQLPTNIFKIGQNQNDTLQLEDINMQGLDESLRLEELKMEQHELNQMHGKLVDNQFSRFELLMSKFSQKDNTNKNSTDNQRSQEISEFKSDSIQKQSNTTSSSRQTTAAKSPFNVRKEPSASSISTLPLSMAPSSIRGSAMSRSNTSSNHRKIKLRISDIIFKEATTQDIEYILECQSTYSPPQFKDIQTDEVLEVSDISEWIETINRQNQENQIIDGVNQRGIVGMCCFYRQDNRMHQEREDLRRVEEMIGILKGNAPPQTKEAASLDQRQQEIAKKFEDLTLIGIILMQFQLPTDQDFPETLKLLPIFWPFKSKPVNPDGDPNTPQNGADNNQANFHANNSELNRDDLEQQNLIQERILQEKASKNQVAKILMIGVVPQCKRSGIGTLIYKKALHIIEQEFPHCVLVYFQRDQNFLSNNWRSLHSFLCKNHFKIINDSKILGDTINERTLFYYNITSLQLDKQRSSHGLFAEFIKVVCRNPLAICNREGQKKLKKELRRVKLKYENEDIEDQLEEFKTEQDVEEPQQKNNQQQSNFDTQFNRNNNQIDIFEIHNPKGNFDGQMTNIIRNRTHDLNKL